MIAEKEFKEILSHINMQLNNLAPHRRNIVPVLMADHVYEMLTNIKNELLNCADVVSRYKEEPFLKNDW